MVALLSRHVRVQGARTKGQPRTVVVHTTVHSPAPPQPDFSAYRESAFGHIGLTFDSATQATWSFYRIGENTAADTVTITRHPQDCGVKA